jgi:uncharacterized protein YkwD
LLKKTRPSKSFGLAALLFLASACSSEESYLLQQNYSENEGFRVAVVAATPAQADAKHDIYISAPQTIVRESIQFCVGTADTCTAANAEKFGVIPHLSRTGFYKVDRSFSITPKQHYTVSGKDGSGQVVQTTIRIDDNDCHLAPDDFTCRVEMEVLRLTNVKRAASGRTEFTNAKYIGCASRLWSQEMARRGSISHDWFSNGTLRQKYRNECSGTGTISAENVAMSGGSSQTPEAVATTFVNMWWNSSGHRANMLGNYRSMGVGFFKRGNSWYGTQNFGAE